MDSYTYLHNQAQAQFSDSKREVIEKQKLGKSHSSWGVIEQMRGTAYINISELEKLAKLKGKPLAKCEICGLSFMVGSTRETNLALCPIHKNQKSTVERLGNKKSTLSTQDFDYLKRTKTTSTGPFWPNPEAIKKGNK